MLLVDDDPTIRALLTAVVDAEFRETSHAVTGGVRVLVAKSGTEAIEALADQSIAVVVLDLMMPDVNGYVVLKACKEAGALARILVLSAIADDETARDRAYELGADLVIGKPFDPIRVMRLLRQWVEQAWAESIAGRRRVEEDR